MILDLCIYEAISYMHSAMKTVLVGMAINYHSQFALIYEMDKNNCTTDRSVLFRMCQKSFTFVFE